MFGEGIEVSVAVGMWVVLLILIILFLSHKYLTPTIYRPKGTASDTSIRLRFMIKISIVIVCLLYICNIRIPTDEKTVSQDISQIQIILDVSLSMAADDISPSRFVVAKQLIADMLSVYTDSSLSLLVFSGIPIVQIPFTKDVGAFLSHVEQLSLTDFPPTVDFLGTALGDALLLGIDRLADGSQIILITDGDSSIGIDPLEVIELAREKNISISPFAVGDEEYRLGLDKQGREVIAYIDVNTLQQVADRTGGIFYHMLPSLSDQDFSQIIEETVLQKEIILHIVYFYLNDFLVWVLLGLASMHLLLQISLFNRLSLFMKK